MRNWQRWGLALLLGFASGAGAAAMDKSSSFGDIMRHGIGGVLPAIAGLKMTLNQDESGVAPNDKSFKAGA